MPIRLDKNIPVFSVLQKRGVFVMDIDKANAQDIRPLRIGILNLMPKKEETEAQLFTMIGDTPLQVDPILIRTTSYTPKNVSASHLEKFYVTFDEAKQSGLDGLIITGAPVELMPFEAVGYWKEVVEIMDWARLNVASTLHLCWAAQAGLYHYFGIEKHDLPQKCFGVFRHWATKLDDPLMKDIDDEYWVPHSRRTEVKVGVVEKHPKLDILSSSDEAGLHLVATTDRKLVFQFGHPEYDTNTLLNEYERDISKGEKIAQPQNYFINNDEQQAPRVRWRANAAIFYRNWINHVYQTTPYDLKTEDPDR